MFYYAFPLQTNESAIEIPVKLARHLKLDDERSWIKTHQINTVEWEKNRLPFGVVPAHKGQWVFGQLPQSIGKQVFDQVKENIDRKHVRRKLNLYFKESHQNIQEVGSGKEPGENRSQEKDERSR